MIWPHSMPSSVEASQTGKSEGGMHRMQRSKLRQIICVLGSVALCLSASPGFGGSRHARPGHSDTVQRGALHGLAAEWWQWVLSIPESVNPLLDETGDDCVVGQRGPIWFLAGTFFGGTAERECPVPSGTRLFFPVINSEPHPQAET